MKHLPGQIDLQIINTKSIKTNQIETLILMTSGLEKKLALTGGIGILPCSKSSTGNRTSFFSDRPYLYHGSNLPKRKKRIIKTITKRVSFY